MKILHIKKQTDNKFLNLYELDKTNKMGKIGKYYLASRAESIENLKLKTKENTPDGVVIYALTGKNKDKIVLIRQYRYPINGYIYEFPAGLVEEGEDYAAAAARELFEETGLKFTKVNAPKGYERPFFTSVGMSDESCSTVFGYCEGSISDKYQEENEEIKVVIADKSEVRRILKEENLAIMVAYMLMHFLKDKEPFEFLKEEQYECF